MRLTRKNSQSNIIRVASSVAWAETLLLTLSVPLIGYFLHKDDPFFLNYPFPWLLFASLLPAIRYGFSHGFASAMILISLITLAWRFELVPISEFPTSYTLGLLVLTMLMGEFTDMWLRKLGKQEVITRAQKKRLDEFTRNYQLLKVSHDRLENRLASGTNSLRDALVSLKLKANNIEDKSNVLTKIASNILAILADYSYVQSANIYPMQSSNEIKTKPVATLGKTVIVDSSNPLIIKAIETGHLVSVNNELKTNDNKLQQTNNLLVTVPLSDIEGYIWGVVAIQEMPFVAFHNENLQLIAVLCGHIGDQISHAENRSSFTSSESSTFLHFLERTIFDRKQFKIETILLVLTLPEDSTLSGTIKTILLAQMRGLDRAWVRKNTENRSVVFLLMPLTSIIEFEGYKNRMSDLLKERTGKSWDELEIETNLRELTGKENGANMIQNLCRATRIDQ